MMTSPVLRLSPNATTAVLNFLVGHDAGMHVLPAEVLPPRQVRITEPKLIGNVPCVLKYHRGSCVPVIPQSEAQRLVASSLAKWEPQRALVYSMEAYLDDNDVKSDPVEFQRAKACASLGETLVLVAIIGESRSPLAVVRNIVSGCQKAEKLDSDAKGALEAANVFLVED